MKDPGFIDVFNKIAPKYDRRFGKSCEKAHDIIFDKITSFTPGSILDIGCGTGKFLASSRKIWPDSHVFGIDPAEAMIQQARKQVMEGQFYVGRAEELPFSSDSMDLIVSTSAFSHWMDQTQGLTEICRVLAPNGHCIIVDHYRPNVIIELFLFLINRLANLRSMAEMYALVNQVGLQVLDIQKKESFFMIHAVR